MNGNSAHWHRLAAVRAPFGEGDIEARRRHLCVFEEQLEEVAHAIEEQCISRLRLEAMVLRHHRRLGKDRGHGPLPSGSGLAAPSESKFFVEKVAKALRNRRDNEREQRQIHREEALDFHARGPARQDRDRRDQADGDAARPDPGLFARRRGAGRGDRRGSEQAPTSTPPRATWWRSSPTAPRCSGSAISAPSPASR